MSYVPTEWATGDVVTAEKLNNMESGIKGNEHMVLYAGVVVPNETDTENRTISFTMGLAFEDGSKMTRELFNTLTYQGKINTVTIFVPSITAPSGELRVDDEIAYCDSIFDVKNLNSVAGVRLKVLEETIENGLTALSYDFDDDSNLVMYGVCKWQTIG